MSYAVPYAGGRHRTDRDPIAVTEATSAGSHDSTEAGRPGRLKSALRRIGQGIGNRSLDESADLTEAADAGSTSVATVFDDIEMLPERLPTRRAVQPADVGDLLELDDLTDFDNVISLPSQPCFDVTDVLHLAGELDDRLFPWHFAGRYREQLDVRLGRIEAALEAGDLDAALEVTLSLKVTSTLVGTRELAELSTSIEAELRAEDLSAARASAAQLPAVAARAVDALSPYLSA